MLHLGERAISRLSNVGCGMLTEALIENAPNGIYGDVAADAAEVNGGRAEGKLE